MLRGLILVSYYARTVDDIVRLLKSFEAVARKRHQEVLVVDNAGFLPLGTVAGDGRLEIIRGSNSSWEFSGWYEGLSYAARWPSTYVLTLLNDSYQRNWTITKASRSIIDAMYGAADNEVIAGWLDNFSMLKRPHFSRRPNSRLIVLAASSRDVMANSLRTAIESCRAITNSGGELFNAIDHKRLEAWIASQPGRWTPEISSTRLQRIFLEHHMFDGVPHSRLQFFPRTYGGTLVYGVLRRLFREQR